MRLSRAEIMPDRCSAMPPSMVKAQGRSSCHEQDAALRDAVLRTAPQDGGKRLCARAPVHCARRKGRDGPPARRVNGKGRVGPP
jgi:hypothetical protein